MLGVSQRSWLSVAVEYEVVKADLFLFFLASLQFSDILLDVGSTPSLFQSVSPQEVAKARLKCLYIMDALNRDRAPIKKRFAL